MRFIYHQKLFLYDLTRPYLGQCDPMRCLKLFLKKVSILQLLLEKSLESNKEKNIVIVR